MDRQYYTLKDMRDRNFQATMTPKEIADYLDIKIWLNIYDLDETIKAMNNGDAGYYIYELNRDF